MNVNGLLGDPSECNDRFRAYEIGTLLSAIKPMGDVGRGLGQRESAGLVGMLMAMSQQTINLGRYPFEELAGLLTGLKRRDRQNHSGRSLSGCDNRRNR